MPTIDSVVENFMQLDPDSREIVLNILSKRQADIRRNEIAKSAKQTLKSYHSGKIKPQAAEQIISYINKT